MKLEGLTVSVLGDSITAGVGITHPSKKYINIIKSQYGLKEVNSYGINGTRITRQDEVSEYPSWDLHFALRVPEMKDADLVIVFGGTNDFGHGLAPIGEFSDRCDNTFYGALHNLYTMLIEKYQGRPIIIMTPLHRLEENEVRVKHGVPVTLKTYVDIIKEVAEYYSLPVCDMYSISGIQPAIDVLREKYMPDGLHPNDAGHELLAARLASFLLSL